MNRIMIGAAAAVGLALSAGSAVADPGGYVPPGGSAGASSLPTFSQIAGPNTLLGAGDLPPGKAPDRYGLHPCIKKFFHIPTASVGPNGYGPNGHNPLGNPANWSAAGYGTGGPAYSPNPFPPGAYGQPGMMPGAGHGGGYGGGPYGPQNAMMQGTLAFPYNSLTRSPRDYFMLDLNK